MSQPTKRLLVIGAGRMAFPCVEYATRKKYSITVVSFLEEELKQISSQLPDVKTELLDIIQNPKKLGELVAEHDVVASLVLPEMQSAVAEHCIFHKKSMVNACYLSDDMLELDQRAKDAGIAIITECGLDPGLDHMISKYLIDTVKKDGGTILSFSSLCGGLPSPEFADGPLKYKFSWNPKGMLTASVLPAKYLKEGKIIEIAAGHIYDDVKELNIILEESVDLDYIPNRNALPYLELYDIPSAANVYRGTLRHKGFSNVMSSLICLGLISSENFPALAPFAPEIKWRELISHLLKLPKDSSMNTIAEAWAKICQRNMVPMETIFSILDENELAPKAPSLLDSLSLYLIRKLAFAPGETDFVVMRNQIEYMTSNKKQQRLTADLVEKGEPFGVTAMARTVGITMAVTAALLLEGAVNATGVIIPVSEEIYAPVLDEIKNEGIQIRMSTVDL